MPRTLDGFDLLAFIVERGLQAGDRLPALEELSAELQISIGKLREQLEVARTLGLVEVKPRTGIRVCPYNFLPAVRLSLLYALAQDRRLFDAYSALRNHVEFAFFHEAVALLTAEDHSYLKSLVERAFAKLDEDPPRIPHVEHRELHLTIYRRLNNPFVRGLLEAYWDAYEAEGLSVFSDYDYLHEVWTHHAEIVNAIADGDIDKAYQWLVRHTELLQQHPKARAARNAISKSTVRQPAIA